MMDHFRGLQQPKVKWVWTPELRKEFQDAKKEIIRLVENGVKTCNTNLMTCILTDWSKIGIGFLFTQKRWDCSLEKAPRCCNEGWQIVFAGSKKCLGTGSRYAPVEVEALGVAWSLEKARMFTLGCPNLLVTTDQQGSG